MRHQLQLWAAVFVGIGATYALTSGGRDSTPLLLATGLVLAVAALLMDRPRRR